jgi:UDP-N-acetylglucosamine 4,6-dehydratase
MAIKFSFGVDTCVGNVLIYGAGSAGKLLLTALDYRKDINVLAFIDDKKELVYQQIGKLKIHTPHTLPLLIKKYRPQSIILALPSIAQSRREKILCYLEHYNLKIFFIPDLVELAHGYRQIDDLRTVKIEDLIDRDPAPPNIPLQTKITQDKFILVSGAGGLVGAGLCHQLIKLKPKRLVLLDCNENALNTIFSELQDRIEDTIELKASLGTIEDYDSIKHTMKKFSINIVYHTAAYKIVPIGSHNIISFVENNILGTANIVKAAAESKVERFIFASSAHASQPKDLIGATERFSELIVQSFVETYPETNFSSIRLGQTMSSSLIPLFHEQLNHGEHFSTTEPDCLCYPMTISEVVQLIIQASSMSKSGDLFTLNMGKSKHIVDLTYRLMHLMGTTTKDKKHLKETRFDRTNTDKINTIFCTEGNAKTENDKIMYVHEKKLPSDQVQKSLKYITDAVEKFDAIAVNHVLKEIIQVYVPPS